MFKVNPKYNEFVHRVNKSKQWFCDVI